jgi:GAF domain-containing protein
MELDRLVDEHAALQRVAVLVAQAVQPAEIFASVSEEVGRLFDSDMAVVGRYDPDGPAFVVVGLAKAYEGLAVGSRFELDDSMAVAEVHRTGRSARRDEVNWTQVAASISPVASRLAAASSVASPIVVDGRVWGAISVTAEKRLPADVGQRLEKFTGLVATAFANAESREALALLADEQAALRQVATLVAAGTEPRSVFAVVAAEIARLFEAEMAMMFRLDSDWTASLVAGTGWRRDDVFRLGRRWAPENTPQRTRDILMAGEAFRIDERRRTRRTLGGAPRRGDTRRGWRPDLRRGSALGRAGGRVPAWPVAERHGGTDREIHRAGGDGYRERRVARGARTSRRRAGGAETGRDARRRRRSA